MSFNLHYLNFIVAGLRQATSFVIVKVKDHVCLLKFLHLMPQTMTSATIATFECPDGG